VTFFPPPARTVEGPISSFLLFVYALTRFPGRRSQKSLSKGSPSNSTRRRIPESQHPSVQLPSVTSLNKRTSIKKGLLFAWSTAPPISQAAALGGVILKTTATTTATPSDDSDSGSEKRIRRDVLRVRFIHSLVVAAFILAHREFLSVKTRLKTQKDGRGRSSCDAAIRQFVIRVLGRQEPSTFSREGA